MRAGIAILGIVCLISACQREQAEEPLCFPALMEIPTGFPALPEPGDNVYSPERWALGKKLFFDMALSVDSTVSCASCHLPELAFSDQVAFSEGVQNRIGFRNVPSLANVAYHPYFTREGGVPTLEMQVLVPIQESHEFDYNIVLLADRLAKDSAYAAMAQQAYSRSLDPFVITRAIACFERSLISGNSPYDQYVNQGKTDALSASAIRGMQLFFSDETNCSSCHSGFNFSNYAFENNGLYKHYPDPGRYRLTGNPADSARFKVPGLRNIALTAPYMHDGSLNTLDEVVEHYRTGGKGHVHQSPLIKPLAISDAEKKDLIAFLQALTDQSFVQNPIFQQ